MKRKPKKEDSKPNLQPFYVRCSEDKPGLFCVVNADGKEIFHCSRADCCFNHRRRLATAADPNSITPVGGESPLLNSDAFAPPRPD